MSMIRIRRAALVVVAGLAAAAAAAQSAKFDLMAGYQWLDLDGNEPMYRTQVNEDDGFVLRSFSLSVVNRPGSLVDRLRVEASDLGASPQQRLRIQAHRARAFDLSLSYFKADHVSYLPGLANPFLEDGVVPGQHTLDRTLESVELDVELLPGRAVTPLLGYSRHTYDGSGRTTFHVGQDEFQLASRLDETVSELRAGVAFRAGSFHGQVLQGWRSVESTDAATLLAGAEGGNGPRPFLGVDSTLDGYSRRADVEVDAPVTSAYLTGSLSDAVRVVGAFVSSEAESETSEDESLSGNLVSFALRRFFGGREGVVDSRAENPYWRGNARIEADLLDDVQLTAGLVKRHRELDGTGLITELYLDTVTYSGADAGDLTEMVATRNALERDESVFDARVTVRDLGPVRVWAGWSVRDQDLTVEPSAAEIVIPGGQGGAFERDVTGVNAGAALRTGGFDLSAEWWQEESDQVILRTDFTERERWRLRAGWTVGMLRLLGTADLSDAAAAVLSRDGMNIQTRSWGGEVSLTPSERFSARAGYSLFRTDTAFTYRHPETFSVVESLYAEEGELFEGGLLWDAGRAGTIDLGWSSFENTGSLPFDLERGWLRYSVELSASLGAAVELETHEYNETALPIADFDATRYGLFLRWHN